MAEVVKLYPRQSSDPDYILELSAGEFQDVIVLGYDHDGIMHYRSSSALDNAALLWLLEQFKVKLLAGEYQDDE